MSTETNAEESGVMLTDEECAALARRLAALHLASDWLEWEDLPELTQRSFERVERAVAIIADELTREANRLDGKTFIDSGALLEQAGG